MVDMENIIEERIRFRNVDFNLSGILAYPAFEEPQRTILLCSPHPHFAGDMNNNLIQSLGSYLAKDNVTLRFDYRGVGESEIRLPVGLSVFDYWESIETNRDYDDAIADVYTAAKYLRKLDDTLPLLVCGYSFGAITAARLALAESWVERYIGISPPWTRVDISFLKNYAKPSFILCSCNDFLYNPEEIQNVRQSAFANLRIEIMKEGDHFFRGEETRICRKIEQYIFCPEGQTGE